MAAERISRDIRADVARMSKLLKTVAKDPARFDALIATPAEVLAGQGIELEKYASKAMPAEVIAQQVAVAAVQAVQGMMVAKIKAVMDLVAVTAHDCARTPGPIPTSHPTLTRSREATLTSGTISGLTALRSPNTAICSWTCSSARCSSRSLRSVSRTSWSRAAAPSRHRSCPARGPLRPLPGQTSTTRSRVAVRSPATALATPDPGEQGCLPGAYHGCRPIGTGR